MFHKCSKKSLSKNLSFKCLRLQFVVVLSGDKLMMMKLVRRHVQVTFYSNVCFAYIKVDFVTIKIALFYFHEQHITA